MQKNELPFWLFNTTISGREEDKPDDQEGEEDESDDADDDSEEGEDEGEGDGSGDGGDAEARAKALEESLKKERKLRRAAEREARKASKKKDADKESADAAELRKQLEAQEAKTQRLAEGYRNSAVDNAILAEARRLGFIDETDALRDDVRSQVDIDQDEDDPSDIDIDFDTVKDAVKKLADKKKHLLGKPNEGERSGSKFRKRSGSSSNTTDEAALQELYPGLRDTY